MMKQIVENVEKIRKEGGQFEHELRERTLSYVIAGFSVVAGLAWNDAISTLIGVFFPLSKDSIWAKLVYAIIVTLVVVFVTVYLVRLLKKDSGSPSA